MTQESGDGSIACRWCGGLFSRRNRGGDKNWFCSRKCSKQPVKAERQAREREVRERKQAQREAARIDREALLRERGAGSNGYVPRQPRRVTCCGCGVELIVRQGRRFLCDRCRFDRKKQQRRDRRKKVGRDRDGLARARRAGSERDYTINTLKVLERDKWTCQLCGCKTPKRARGTYGGNAPEIDHVVAIALGGGHTLDNLQCLCRKCNSAKGAKALGQPRLPLYRINSATGRDKSPG